MRRVRELSIAEGQSLSRLVRRTRDVTVRNRATVILHSHQGFSPPKIARMVRWSELWVRRIIADYNRMGTKALYPKWAGGRPPTFTKRIRHELVDLALSSPKHHGLPIARWTLERLRYVAIRDGIVETISPERLRQILHEEAVSFQAIKTWKQSNDPRFVEKARRLRGLTNRLHNPPIVVAADEMGPISLKPYGGRTWARSGHPDRVPATYRRLGGTRYFFGMYDYYHDRLHDFLSPTKHARVWCRFLRYVRRHYPSGARVYLINDNLSTHWTPRARRWARALRISMVPTPTNASHLNPIESHFATLKGDALTGSNHPNWRELGRALQGALRERNRHSVPRELRRWARPKRRLWAPH
jgi:transposase